MNQWSERLEMKLDMVPHPRLGLLWRAYRPRLSQRACFVLSLCLSLVLVASGLLILSRRYLPARAELFHLHRQLAEQQKTAEILTAQLQRYRSLQARHDELQERAAELQQMIPAPEDVPLVIELLGQVATAAGGRVLRLDCYPPKSEDSDGRVRVLMEWSGQFPGLGRFLALMKDALPSLMVQQMLVQQVQAEGEAAGQRVKVAFDLLFYAFPKDQDSASWHPGAVGPEGTEEVLPDLFAPPAEFLSLALEKKQADLSSWSDLFRLAGVAQMGDVRLALLEVDGRTYIVRPGDEVLGVKVVEILAGAVRLEAQEQSVLLTLHEKSASKEVEE